MTAQGLCRLLAACLSAVAAAFLAALVARHQYEPDLPQTMYILGAVSSSAAMAWVRCTSHESVAVQFREADVAPWTSLDLDVSAEHHIGTVRLDGLQPGTLYEWRVGVDAGSSTPPLPSRFFKTPPASDSPPERQPAFSFSWGSCVAAGPTWPMRELTAFGFIQERLQPDFLALLGDTTYTDIGHVFGYEIPYRIPFGRAYRQVFADRHFRSMLETTPSYVQFDDHEVENDWTRGVGGREHPLEAEGLAAFERWMASRNLNEGSGGGHWYTFQHGPSLAAFVLDTRTHRTHAAPDARTTTGDGCCCTCTRLSRCGRAAASGCCHPPAAPASKLLIQELPPATASASAPPRAEPRAAATAAAAEPEPAAPPARAAGPAPPAVSTAMVKGRVEVRFHVPALASADGLELTEVGGRLVFKDHAGRFLGAEVDIPAGADAAQATGGAGLQAWFSGKKHTLSVRFPLLT